METEYCPCCGRKKSTIMKFLKKQKSKDKKKIWKGHTLYKGKDYFYDSDELVYCENCGGKLDDEDIHQVSESRGEFWGAPCSETVIIGYKCKCGFEEKF